jgi:mannitol-1-phosphate 5-dehydrogenase
VQFGAGNIGRGFIGQLLHDSGHEVVFVDVAERLIDELASASAYRVIAVGDETVVDAVTGFRALNSARDPLAVVAEIARAEIVTTAVGVRVLPALAPLIGQGILARSAEAEPVAVMACENAVGATDALAAAIEAAVGDEEWSLVRRRAVFANTAVDRIVPAQQEGSGLDVIVEDFSEWVVEEAPFHGRPPRLRNARFVHELAPYIERKLFTVNTGHATAAYCGHLIGARTISAALEHPRVTAAVAAALEETSAALVARHGIDPEEQAAYRRRILDRFRNVHLDDEVERVARDPLRKLGRHDRFVAPAAELAERGTVPLALLHAMGAALRFRSDADEESLRMGELLRHDDPFAVVEQITGLAREHPLFAPLAVVADAAKRDESRMLAGA